jgi:hypothetical protein
MMLKLVDPRAVLVLVVISAEVNVKVLPETPTHPSPESSNVAPLGSPVAVSSAKAGVFGLPELVLDTLIEE